MLNMVTAVGSNNVVQVNSNYKLRLSIAYMPGGSLRSHLASKGSFQLGVWLRGLREA